MSGRLLLQFTLALLIALTPQATLAGSVDNEKTNFGSACSGSANGADWDTIFQCNGSTWQRGAYFFGSTSDTCDANHAGMTQWTGSALKYCNGTSWLTVQTKATNGYIVLTYGTGTAISAG